MAHLLALAAGGGASTFSLGRHLRLGWRPAARVELRRPGQLSDRFSPRDLAGGVTRACSRLSSQARPLSKET